MHFFSQRPELLDGPDGRMLHVAPEKCLRRQFERNFNGEYLTADFLVSGVDIVMDIQNIQFPDRHFDAVYCSHVLEHVDDDRKAMREFRRVLADDGWLILMVPITAAKTIEDPTITDPQERLRLFGQIDHVRRYGPDFEDRLREAGLDVTVFTSEDIATPGEIGSMALTPGRKLFFCRKG